MRITILNFVCPGCMFFAENEMEKMNIQYKVLKHGEFELTSHVSQKLLNQLQTSLKGYNMEITFDDRKQYLTPNHSHLTVI